MLNATVNITRKIGYAIRLGDRSEVGSKDMGDDLFHGTANLNLSDHRLVIIPVIFEVIYAVEEVRWRILFLIHDGVENREKVRFHAGLGIVEKKSL